MSKPTAKVVRPPLERWRTYPPLYFMPDVITEVCDYALELERRAKALNAKIDGRINEIDPESGRKVWNKGCLKMLFEVQEWTKPVRDLMKSK